MCKIYDQIIRGTSQKPRNAGKFFSNREAVGCLGWGWGNYAKQEAEPLWELQILGAG